MTFIETVIFSASDYSISNYNFNFSLSLSSSRGEEKDSIFSNRNVRASSSLQFTQQPTRLLTTVQSQSVYSTCVHSAGLEDAPRQTPKVQLDIG